MRINSPVKKLPRPQSKNSFDKTGLNLIVVEKLDNLKRSASGRSNDFKKALINYIYRELLEIIQKQIKKNQGPPAFGPG